MIITRSKKKGVETVAFNKPNDKGERITLFMWNVDGQLETKVEAVKNLTLVSNDYDPNPRRFGFTDTEENRQMAIRATLTRAFGIGRHEAIDVYEKGVTKDE